MMSIVISLFYSFSNGVNLLVNSEFKQVKVVDRDCDQGSFFLALLSFFDLWKTAKKLFKG